VAGELAGTGWTAQRLFGTTVSSVKMG
jgi:hypothetical protein